MPLYRDLTIIGPPRWYGNWATKKKLIVVHCTANTATAAAEARYATTRSDRVSSHYYVDDSTLIQSLNTDLVAWHAGNAQGNTTGIAYEFTGLASWSRERWLVDPDDIHQAARQMARDCQHWGIPARWLTVDQLRAGWAGLTTHDDVRRAWGGTHTDPGPGFPRDVLLDAVRRALEGETDMPIRTSLGKTGLQPLAWERFTVISWDTEHADPGDAHRDGNYPGYVSEVDSWADSQATMRVQGLQPGDSYQVQYILHGWQSGGPDPSPWSEVVADQQATAGDQFIVGTVSKRLPAGSHLWVAVAVFRGDPGVDRPVPQVVAGRWTLRQDR